MIGAVLSDESILNNIHPGHLLIRPFQEPHLQPASYDLTLAQDVNLRPLEFFLASSMEWIEINGAIRGDLATRSSVARLGVFAHLGAGFFDPGFRGEATFELFNASSELRCFKRGDRIAQIAFTWLDSVPSHMYRGRYLEQRGPTDSRFLHGEM